MQSLHNYRLLCPAATFLRNGSLCEECVDHSLLRSIRYGCYRGSRAATTVVAGMLAAHRKRGTGSEQVDRYIALTEFARAKWIAGGLPVDRVVVKPNFVHPDPGVGTGPGSYVLYAGRLAPEKGLQTLMAAWRRLETPIPLQIAGDGPLRPMLEAEIAREGLENIRLLGSLPRGDVLKALQGARCLVLPSLWYEGFPLMIVEAFACGVPVITSRLGSMCELVTDGRTGLHFDRGDPASLARTIDAVWSESGALAEMGRAARREYEARYTAERNAALLEEIYAGVIAGPRTAAQT